MRKTRFTDEQTVAILQETERSGKTGDTIRRHGICRETFYRHAFAAVLTAGSVASTPDCAQQVGRSLPTRADMCRRSETEFRERRNSEAYRRAVADLQSCPEVAAPLFAAEWRHPPTDSVELSTLTGSSGSMARRELFDALEAVAWSPGFTRAPRLAALNAMVGQALPDRGLNYTGISRVTPPGRQPVAFLYYSSSPRGGRLDGGARRELLTLFEQLGRSDGDEVVRPIGRFLALHMRRYLESHCGMPSSAEPARAVTRPECHGSCDAAD